MELQLPRLGDMELDLRHLEEEYELLLKHRKETDDRLVEIEDDKFVIMKMIDIAKEQQKKRGTKKWKRK